MTLITRSRLSFQFVNYYNKINNSFNIFEENNTTSFTSCLQSLIGTQVQKQNISNDSLATHLMNTFN